MKKSVILIILLVVLIVCGIVFITNNESKPVVDIATAESLEAIITQVNEKSGLELGSLATNVVEVADKDAVTYYTGLKANDKIEHIVVSEPMMSSQAYSFVLVKATEDADIEAMKQEMIDNIDTRKWICVEAEKVYVTNHESLICLVMADEEWAKPVFAAFLEVVDGKTGEVLERTSEITELPEDQPVL